MWQAWDRTGMHRGFVANTQNEGGHFEDTGVDGGIIFM
jgi:hypothetical protein